MYPQRTIGDWLKMLFYNPQGNSDMCKNEIGLFHVVLERPFDAMENNTSSAVMEN